jgi:hypothetical protein
MLLAALDEELGGEGVHEDEAVVRIVAEAEKFVPREGWRAVEVDVHGRLPAFRSLHGEVLCEEPFLRGLVAEEEKSRRTGEASSDAVVEELDPRGGAIRGG